MVAINKKFLAARFSKASSSYEEATPVQKQMTEFLFSEVVKRLKNKQINSILEIGCGTGRLTKKLAENFSKAKITAIDISPKMIALAQKNYPQATYITADIEDEIDLLDDKFDLIISSATVQWLENPKATLQKAKNLLKDGGLLAIATFTNQTFCELSQSFDHAYFKNNLEPKSHIVPIPSLFDWKKMISDAEIFDDKIIQFFPSVRDFLKSIQNAGAVNSSSCQAIITKSIFKDMSSYYLQNFSDSVGKNIAVTYCPCYIFTK